MLEKFLIHLREKCRLQGGERVLLALSGGVDSMAMAHLFRLAGWPHGIAHCHFGLRGDASDADEALVRTYARQYGLPFFCTHFDTLRMAAEAGESIQITARRLRYAWLEELRAGHGYDFIATAHHADDNSFRLPAPQKKLPHFPPRIIFALSFPHHPAYYPTTRTFAQTIPLIIFCQIHPPGMGHSGIGHRA